MLSTFSCTIFAIHISSLVKGLFKSLAHFFFKFCFSYYWVVKVLCSGYKYFIQTFVKDFLPICCLSFFLTMSFEEQLFLILMKSDLSIFFCVSYAFCALVKKSLPILRSQRCSLRFSSEVCFGCFSFFLAVPWGMWDLGSPTRDWTPAPCVGSAAS